MSQQIPDKLNIKVIRPGTVCKEASDLFHKLKAEGRDEDARALAYEFVLY